MTSEQLFYDKKTGFDRLTEADRQGIQTYAEGYKTFLDEAKTERDAVKEIARMAEGMDLVKSIVVKGRLVNLIFKPKA